MWLQMELRILHPRRILDGRGKDAEKRPSQDQGPPFVGFHAKAMTGNLITVPFVRLNLILLISLGIFGQLSFCDSWLSTENTSPLKLWTLFQK